MIDKMQRIADYYGYEAQSCQLIEEMAELTKAINKLWRCENGHLRDFARYDKSVVLDICRQAIVEEIADVEICLKYVKCLLDIKAEDVDKVKEVKIEREMNRIAEQELDKRNLSERNN